MMERRRLIEWVFDPLFTLTGKWPAMSVLDNVNLGFRRRLPMLLQTEAAECGLACIAMIASYLGHETDLAHLRRRYGLSLRGATLRDPTRTSSSSGSAR